MKSNKRIFICIAAAAAVLAAVLIICLGGGPGNEKLTDAQTLELWYADTDLMTSRVESLTAEYNVGEGARDGVTVNAKAFAGEAELYDALRNAAFFELPDLVICDTNFAAALEAEDMLADIGDHFGKGDVRAFSDVFAMLSHYENDLIAIPLGATAGLYMENTKLLNGVSLPVDMEGLCEEAKSCYKSEGRSFFTMSDYSYFFRSAIAQLGEAFDAENPYDSDSENCKYVYNLLAETAYDRGFTACEGNPAQLVADGELSCALVSTAEVMSAAAETDPAVCRFAEQPVIRGGEKVYALKVTGITMLDGSENEELASAMFIKWLTDPDRLSKLNADTGYVSPNGSMICEGEIGKELKEIMHGYLKKYENVIARADADFGGNMTAFNDVMRSIMISLG